MERLSKTQQKQNDEMLEIRALFGDQDAINAIDAQKLITKSVTEGIPLTFEENMLCGRVLLRGRVTNNIDQG